MIDSYLDDRDTLADDPDMALAAGALDGLGVYSGLLLGDVGIFAEPGLCEQLGIEEDDCEESMQELRSRLGIATKEPWSLEKYIRAGTGVGHDKDGFYTVLVFVYEDEDMAKRNVRVFENILAEGFSWLSDSPWSELFPHSEVWNEDRTLIAKLRTDKARMYQDLVFSDSSLLDWHE